MALSVLAPAYLPGLGLSGWRRSEDFLTGEFFGLLRYLPPSLGVLPALSAARSTDKQSFATWLGQNPAGIEVQLWPWIGSSIPDVLVRLYEDEQRTNLLADVLVVVDCLKEHFAEDVPVPRPTRGDEFGHESKHGFLWEAVVSLDEFDGSDGLQHFLLVPGEAAATRVRGEPRSP